MRFLRKNEECIGKYSTKQGAIDFALSETNRTGLKHREFLTHYLCPYEFIDIIHWTVILAKN